MSDMDPIPPDTPYQIIPITVEMIGGEVVKLGIEGTPQQAYAKCMEIIQQGFSYRTGEAQMFIPSWRIKSVYYPSQDDQR